MTPFRALAGATLMALVGTYIPHPAPAAQEFEIRIVSSRPDTVSGGDVLVQLKRPAHSAWSAWRDGRDVTPLFRAAEGSDDPLALLTGLKNGKNTLEIRTGAKVEAKLQIRNHPLAGPIFSGPHQKPFICQTAASGLGPAADSDCSAKTIVYYYYKSTEPAPPLFSREAMLASLSLSPGSLAPGFKVYDPSAPTPADVAQTVTSDGRTVNYIVRREIGTLNRAVYDIQFLHQPEQTLPNPWARPTPGWNGRLVYFFGGGCGAAYRQGTLGIVGRIQEPLVAQGYAVATSTLNTFGNECNGRVAAETLSMVKEHFIKQYGKPAHTIGWGTSGGAVEMYLTAQNYPGLLDGIIPFISFPDMTSTAPSVAECSLLDHAFKTSKRPWTEEQKAAVSGFATWRTCVHGWGNWTVLDPRNCDGVIPKELVYDRTATPKGVRCDLYDNEINVLGQNPRTGFARRPLDNVGIQYGLVAFNRGQIDAEQFIELNERVGGYDEDGHIVPGRSEGDLEAIRIAYQEGLLFTGGGGSSQLPIIDWRPYSDDGADQHDSFRSFATRARLIAASGNANNQVILMGPRYDYFLLYTNDNLNEPEARFLDQEHDLVPQMDRWLDNIAADSAAGTLPAKIARNKPEGLADACFATDGERIVEPMIYEGPGRCNQLYPPHGDPRIAAGGPLADDVLKCALKPISPDDYSHPLNPDQLRRLRALFPAGVCDYSRPGVGQTVTRTTWQQF